MYFMQGIYKNYYTLATSTHFQYNTVST